MKILFMGSGEFGLPTLQRLADEHEVVGVITSPDKPSGRNRKQKQTAIGTWATEQNLHVSTPQSVNTTETMDYIEALSPDATVVIAFGQKLQSEIIDARPTINLHASLLPRWRGAAPIHAAILHGDKETGLSVITLAQQMDAGMVLAQVSTPITSTETTGELHDRLSLLGPEVVMEVLESDMSGHCQDEADVTYAPKITRSDAMLDLSRSAEEIARKIRGYSPWPGCHLHVGKTDCKIIRAIPKNGSGAIGEVLEDGTIAVGEGSIEVLELKPAGSNAMTWNDFCNGRAIDVGTLCEVK